MNTLEYRIQVTPELARAAAAPLEQALWLQNERLYEHLRSRFRSHPKLRVAGILLAVVGLALSLLGWTIDPRLEAPFSVFSAAFAARWLASPNGWIRAHLAG